MESPAHISLSHDQRWTYHRDGARDGAHTEPPILPSAASTPASTAPATPPADDLSASQELPAEATLHPPLANGLGIDAEDEDVKIAIMALGAMKSLDGRANRLASAGSSSSSSSRAHPHDAHKRNEKRKLLIAPFPISMPTATNH
jgi:hypothetical protein